MSDTTVERQLIERWPYETVRPTEDEPIRDYTHGVADAIADVRDDIQQLQDEQTIDTATGYQLELLGQEVGVTRQTNETDERLRFRIRIAKSVTQSNGDLYDVERILFNLFGDTVENIEISAPVNEPVIRLLIPADTIDEVPLTIAELEEKLSDILPASDSLEILRADTFILGEGGKQGLGNGRLQ